MHYFREGWQNQSKAVKPSIYVYIGLPRPTTHETTVGVKLKFPFGFRSTEPKWYTILAKNSYKTDKICKHKYCLNSRLCIYEVVITLHVFSLSVVCIH